jgi:hypothetical protein
MSVTAACPDLCPWSLALGLWQIRQEPFTSLAVDFQGGHFDCPDRLFFDVALSYRGCTSSMTDVKEVLFFQFERRSLLHARHIFRYSCFDNLKEGERRK